MCGCCWFAKLEGWLLRKEESLAVVFLATQQVDLMWGYGQQAVTRATLRLWLAIKKKKLTMEKVNFGLL